MQTTSKRRMQSGKAWLLLPALILLFPIGEGSADDRPLTRSLYVPVVFSIAPEIDNLELWIEGEGTLFTPEPRVFQFTFYPELEKVLPEFIEVRLRAQNACAGEDLESNFLITPDGIFSSKRAIAFDPEKLKRQAMSRRRDLRVPTKTIRIRCAAAPSSSPEPGSEEPPR